MVQTLNPAAPQRTVIVTGASSQLGVFLLPRLRAAGFGVMALSRAAPEQPTETAKGVVWARPDAFGTDSPAFALVSCGPLPLACGIVERGVGLERAVAFSTSSVTGKRWSSDLAERALVRRLAVAETRLQALCGERRLPLLLLRPTLIFGCGLDRNVSLLRRVGKRWGIIPLAGAAKGLRQPVHADDLAILAVRALTVEEPINLASAACGGGTLRFRDMAARVGEVCGRPVRLLGLPPGVLELLVRIAALLPHWRGLNREMVRRQNANLVFDDTALREALGYDPRPFQPSPADFEIPEPARRLQLPSHR